MNWFDWFGRNWWKVLVFAFLVIILIKWAITNEPIVSITLTR